MDRFVYVAMTGASELQLAQSVTNHNLANASTVGFKATLAGAQHVPIEGPGFDDARAYAVTVGEGTDFTPGPMIGTGNPLDVAVSGKGWIAVQSDDGTEAYTRRGDLRIDANGILRTGTDHEVLGEGGPISVPPYESIEIAADGTISIRPQGQEAAVLANVERIRLVDPPESELVRGEDGLFRLSDGAPAIPDPEVSLVSQTLEGSNVNLVSSMVEMIEQSRLFELQVNMQSTAQELDQATQELIRLV